MSEIGKIKTFTFSDSFGKEELNFRLFMSTNNIFSYLDAATNPKADFYLGHNNLTMQ